MGLSCILGNFHYSFKYKIARYSSNFGNKLRIMVGIGKECGYTSNIELPRLPRSFIPRKLELRPKMVNSQSDCRTASCIPEWR